MLRKFLLASAIVLACSAEVRAQQRVPQGHHGAGHGQSSVYNNRTVVNNNYYGGGGGWNRGYYGGGGYGYWPGSGPYDSAIAVAGIVAGASIINNLIAAPRYYAPPPTVYVQPAPQVVYTQPQTVVVQQPPVVVNAQPQYVGPQGCNSFNTGTNPTGGPVFITTCP